MVKNRAEERDARLHCSNPNANIVTRSRSTERENETHQAQMSDPDSSEQMQVIDGVQHADPVSFDNILPEDFRRIVTVSWFSCRAILADRESSFAVPKN